MHSTTTASPPARQKSLWANRPFLLLWFGQAVSQIGDAVFYLTLILWATVILARGAAWAPLAVTALTGAEFLPLILIGPLAGVFVDRWNKRRTLLWTDGLRAVLVASLLLVVAPQAHFGPLAQLGLGCLVVFLASICTQFFTPARVVLTGDLVVEDQQAQAASLEQVTSSIALILGPLIAAPLLFAFGVQWALIINSLSFALSWLAILIIRAPAETQAAEASQASSIAREFWEGLRYSLKNRVVRTLLLGFCIAMFGVGFYNALYVFFFLQNLHLAPSLVGLLDAIFGGGVIVGALVAGVFSTRLGLERILALSALAIGLAFIVLARITNPWIAALILALIGACQGALGVVFWPLVLKVTLREFVGRVASILNPATTFSQLISVVLAGYLASTVLHDWHPTVLGLRLGPIDTLLTAAGVVILLAGLYFLKNLKPGLPSVGDDPAATPDELASDLSAQPQDEPSTLSIENSL